ncbi:MAG: hypothetical protein ABI383_16420 [Acidobacteriaceae bacterium]
MPVSQMIANAGKEYLPKVISPRTHAIIDYAVAGTFMLMGGLFFAKNKRASVGAFIIGGTVLGQSLCTDYPGGVFDLISFQTHGKIDTGLSGVMATMPALLGFKDDPEAKHFQAQGVMEALVVGMTDWDAGSTDRQTELKRAV